jgi:uncharacterized protein
MRRLVERLLRALTTLPDRRGWGFTLVVLLAYGAAAAAIGVPTGFLTLAPARLPAGTLLGTSAVLLLHPSLVEELLFRVLPIPHPSEGASTRATALGTALGLLLFLAVHPLNGLALRPAALAVFTSPVFLSLAGLLGLAGSAVYLRTGSVWPAALLHWVAVEAWVFLLGGGALLAGR